MANDNYSNDSIQSTREKKKEEFVKNFDSSVMYDGEDSNEISSSSRRRNREINSYSNEDNKAKIEKESMKALKKQQKEDKKVERKKAKHNKRMFKWLWLIMVVFIGVVLAQIILVGVNDMLAIGREKDPKTVTVSIPKDPTIDQIADILFEKGVISRPKYFSLYTKLTSSADGFKQGDFEIATNKDYEAIVNFLQSNNNRKDVVKVQITEGMNIIEISKLLEENKVIDDVQAFLDLASSDEFDEDFTFLKDIKNKDKRYYKLEGYLFPDTYDFYIAEEPKSVISKMLNNYDNKIYYNEEKYFGNSTKTTLAAESKETGYTMDEITIIASIIQAEAANQDDMYVISSIIHNRLDNGVEIGVPNLGLDSTVYYPYRGKSDVPSELRDTFDSTYNTNKIEGLPPGPICNPSLEAIKAAISPSDTDYYFFCHSSPERGSVPYYAETFDGHQANLVEAGIAND